MSEPGFKVYLSYSDEDGVEIYMTNFPAERVFAGHFDNDEYSQGYTHNGKGYYLSRVWTDLDVRTITYFFVRTG